MQHIIYSKLNNTNIKIWGNPYKIDLRNAWRIYILFKFQGNMHKVINHLIKHPMFELGNTTLWYKSINLEFSAKQ